MLFSCSNSVLDLQPTAPIINGEVSSAIRPEVLAFSIKLTNTQELRALINLAIDANPNTNLNDIDISLITDMDFLFANKITFNGDISQWDISNVNNMAGMFQDAKNFNQDISSWDISQVMSMSAMFMGVRSFRQDLSRWKYFLREGVRTWYTFAAGPPAKFTTFSSKPNWDRRGL